MYYLKAESVSDAVIKLKNAGKNTLILAGGTDIMVSFNRTPVDLELTVVYIGEIEELKKIEEKETKIIIGSLATADMIANNRLIQKYANALCQAAENSAGPQVRNRATIGGNIATSSPAGDMLAALVALDANIIVTDDYGERELKLRDIVTGVKQNSLTYKQVISRIEIPKQGSYCGSYFEKMGKRKAMTISFASTACFIKLDNRDCIKSIQISVGSASKTAVRIPAVENELIDQRIDNNLIKEKSKLVIENISPITDGRATKWYRLNVIPVMLERTIIKAIEDAKKGGF